MMHCLICGHHRGRKSFKESCPRVNDLLFRGGDYSAAQIMEETERNGCPHAIPYQGNVKRRSVHVHH